MRDRPAEIGGFSGAFAIADDDEIQIRVAVE
jgi:hypothetical protein